MTITAIIAFFIILFVLVIVHELGHFLFAKWMKMRVDEFAFGFPPRLFEKKIGETLYSFNLIPLGGYIKIYGENGSNSEANEQNKIDIERSFNSKSPFARILVLLGGVVFNIIAAILLFSFSFIGEGYKSLTTEEALQTPFNDRKIVVTQINEKSAFHHNPFFMIGTEILSVGNQKESIKSEELTSENIGKFVQANQNSIIRIEYKTTIEGETINKVVEVVPQPGIIEGKKALGVSFADVTVKKYNFLQAFQKSITFTYSVIIMIFQDLDNLIKNLWNGQAKIQDSLSGPVGLAIITNKVVDQGIDKILFLAGMLSLSLAVFNILPIPALDGGRILFTLPELLFKKKISQKIENALHGISFILLIALMIFITYFDILKII